MSNDEKIRQGKNRSHRILVNVSTVFFDKTIIYLTIITFGPLDF